MLSYIDNVPLKRQISEAYVTIASELFVLRSRKIIKDLCYSKQ